MPVSKVQIYNMSLGHLGRTVKPVQSMTEQSVEAQTCNLWYDIARQQVLEAQDWSFARRRVAMALHADAPPDEWMFRYQVPADMIAFRRFWNPLSEVPFPYAGWPNADVYGDTLGDAVQYQLEASLDGTQLTMVTNQASAIGLYTADVTLTQLFSPMFVNALTHYMAAKMAISLTSKQLMEDKEYKAFQSALAGATASDANQGVASPPRDAATIRARM